MNNHDNWFLIGSWALKAYGLLNDREPSDIDFLSDQPKSRFFIKGVQVEHFSSNDVLEKTNNFLWQYCQQNKNKKFKTPLGEFWVAPLPVLKILKISSLPLNKAKHFWDLDKLKKVIVPEFLNNIIEMRTAETLSRIEKNKFFNKYHIVRYIDHDLLHLYVSPNPAYRKLLSSEVEISENIFNKLSFEEKYLELFEESFVLALERTLIPAYKKYPFLLADQIIAFKDTKKSSSPARKWLSRLTISGMVKDRPDWISKWGIDNYDNYIFLFDKWWQQTFDSLSEEFWIHFLNIKNFSPLKRD